MRCWQVVRHGDPTVAIELVDTEEPMPGPGEVRLRVLAAAVGLPDVFMTRGSYPFTPTLPFIAGQEVCGIVDMVGPGVETGRGSVVDGLVGTRVMAVTNFYDGRGGFAQFAIARANTVFRVPDAMSDVDAAAFRIGYSTAWNGLVRRGALQAGETVLVLGAAGGSGAAAIVLAKALGATVIAVAAGSEKLAFCVSLGADVVIDRRSGTVPSEVLAATGERGVDLVFDPVGGDLAESVLDTIAPGGRMLAIGFASGRWVQVETHHAVRRSYSLVGVYAGATSREENEQDHEALLNLHSSGRFPSIVSELPFEALPEVLARIERGEVIGKAAVVFGAHEITMR